MHGRKSDGLGAPCGAALDHARQAPARRMILRAAVAAGISLSLLPAAETEEAKPGAEDRPKPGDRFVFSEGDHAGGIITPDALPMGGPPVLAWPMDPRTAVVRDGSRLNQVLLLQLDPASLDEDMRAYAAGGIVAYSAICTHAGCPVTGWVEDEARLVLKCFCHNSEYDPRQEAKVVFGPAPRHLAVLPVRIIDGALTVAQRFIGKVGPTLSG